MKMNLLKKLLRNNKGVSQVVSVLILTSVVIVGAVGAGIIMSEVSSDVSSSASVGNVGDAVENKIVMAGSTTVRPLTECLAKNFMKDNLGIKVSVAGGGSGYGRTCAQLDICDIGAASSDTTVEELEEKGLREIMVGGSGVVVITNDDTITQTQKSEMQACYTNAATCVVNITATVPVTAVYDRDEPSGTEDTFAKYLGDKSYINDAKAAGSGVNGKLGNPGVLEAVASCTGTCIGFVDVGFAEGNDDVKMLTIDTMPPSRDKIADELASQDGTNYVTKLVRTLNYLTSGLADPLEQDFLDYVEAEENKKSIPGYEDCYEQTGYIGPWEFGGIVEQP
ncbi:MAG: substrate-binding domain-containing protein [Candidatus Altiarchaeota archaeon]|nr:substrate-binding domain-containing protein [Candidatus Altiarchaeota archaeon]